MENMIRILRAVDYIEEHLKGSISLKNMAEEACLSEYYFHRVFHLIVGDAPGEYIKKRRLYEAALVLRESDRKVIDVALEWGYNSPEAFSRAFSRHFGINPIDVRDNRLEVIPYAKPALTIQNLNHIHKGVSMEPRIVEKGKMMFVGPVYYGNNENGEIPIFWERHFPKVASLSTRIGKGCFGVCFHTSDYVEKGFFHYMAAVEVESLEEMPSGAVGKIFPAHEYAVFTHRGGPDTLGETYKFIHGTWFPQKTYEPQGDFDFEHYAIDEDGNDVIELYVPVIRKTES